MNYVVIDLEMCKVPKQYQSKYNYSKEIIEIGAVLLNQEYQVIGTQKQFVSPEHGVLDRFISNLTGIQASQVKHAPRLLEALQHLIDWIGDREYQIMAWSDSDRNQLFQELKRKPGQNERIASFMDPDRWVDYQAVFVERYQFTRLVGLKEALDLCEIDPNGRFHDGLDDAVNTARLIEKLELDPEYQLMEEAKASIQLEEEPLNFSLGSLFANLNLQIA